MPPSLHRVRSGPFPCFPGTTRHSDSLTTLPPGFVAFADALPPSPVFRSRGGRVPLLRGPGLFTGFPNRPLVVESSGPPRFLGYPLVCVPCSLTLARPQDLACYGPGLLPSATRTASALATIQFFRGSITRPTHSLSTLRSPGLPGTTQDSLPAGGLLCRAGFEPAGFLREVSAPRHHPQGHVSKHAPPNTFPSSRPPPEEPSTSWKPGRRP